MKREINNSGVKRENGGFTMMKEVNSNVENSKTNNGGINMESEKSLRTISSEEVGLRIKERTNNTLNRWRQSLAFDDGSKVFEQEKRRVEKAIRKAERKLPDWIMGKKWTPARDVLIMPRVRDAIDDSSMKLAIHYFDTQNWDALAAVTALSDITMQLVFPWIYVLVPDDRKNDLTLKSYTWGGADQAVVYEAMTMLPKYGEPDLPDDFEDEIVIYRGCVGSPLEAAGSISWTLNPEVAKYFKGAHEEVYKTPGSIYRGKIRKDDIAAYIYEMGQSEIIQLGTVYDVEDITNFV